MSETVFDCVVIGSGPLPGLVAGLLAEAHGKRVALIGAHWSPFQLRRQIPVAATLMTRPESLKLLVRLREETQRLLARLGKGLVERTDLLMIAETPESLVALSHFRHMARALGWSVEMAVDTQLPDAGLVRLRDASQLVDGRLGPALEAWLKGLGVARVPERDVRLTQRRDGALGIATADGALTAAQVLLGDDAATIAHAPPALLQRQFTPVPMAAFLVEDSRPLAAAVTLYLDRGLLLARGVHGSVHVLASGDPLSVEARIGSTLAEDKPVRGAGEVRFAGLAPVDGAPMLGAVRGEVYAVAGLGAAGPFYAPLVARQLAGASTELEAGWLAPRGPARASQRASVADYIAALP